MLRSAAGRRAAAAAAVAAPLRTVAAPSFSVASSSCRLSVGAAAPSASARPSCAAPAAVAAAAVATASSHSSLRRGLASRKRGGGGGGRRRGAPSSSRPPRPTPPPPPGSADGGGSLARRARRKSQQKQQPESAAAAAVGGAVSEDSVEELEAALAAAVEATDEDGARRALAALSAAGAAEAKHYSAVMLVLSALRDRTGMDAVLADMRAAGVAPDDSTIMQRLLALAAVVAGDGAEASAAAAAAAAAAAGGDDAGQEDLDVAELVESGAAFREARRLFDMLEERTLVAYNLLLELNALAGADASPAGGMGGMAAALGGLENMLEGGGGGASAAGAAGGAQRRQALELLTELERDGLEPDRGTYTALLKLYGALGDYQAARETVRQMKTAGEEVSMDADAYASYIMAHAESIVHAKERDIEEALRAGNIEDLLAGKDPTQGGAQPSASRLQEEADITKAARDALDEAVRTGHGSAPAFCYMMAVHAYQGNIAEALAVRTEMEGRGYVMDAHAYHILLFACAAGESLDVGLQVAEEMIQRGTPPDGDDFAILAQAAEASENVDAATRIMQLASDCNVEITPFDDMQSEMADMANAHLAAASEHAQDHQGLHMANVSELLGQSDVDVQDAEFDEAGADDDIEYVDDEDDEEDSDEEDEGDDDQQRQARLQAAGFDPAEELARIEAEERALGIEIHEERMPEDVEWGPFDGKDVDEPRRRRRGGGGVSDDSYAPSVAQSRGASSLDDVLDSDSDGEDDDVRRGDDGVDDPRRRPGRRA